MNHQIIYLIIRTLSNFRSEPYLVHSGKENMGATNRINDSERISGGTNRTIRLTSNKPVTKNSTIDENVNEEQNENSESDKNAHDVSIFLFLCPKLNPNSNNISHIDSYPIIT